MPTKHTRRASGRKAIDEPFYFFARKEHEGTPAGITVSKREALPEGDFRITEYRWGRWVLWFVDDDRFTASERNEAYLRCCGGR